MATARIQLLHLNGPLRGRTATYDEPIIALGSGAGAKVRYRSATMIAGRHAEIEYVEDACAFHLRAIEGAVFVDNQQVREVILRPEDLIELGAGGPKLRFRIQAEPGRLCKPLRLMLQDARDVGRASGPAASARTLMRDLLTSATWQLKVTVPVLMLALVFGAAYVGGRFESSRHDDHARSLDDLKRLMANVEHDSRALASREEVALLRTELKQRGEALNRIADHDRAFYRALDTHVRSVGLVHGVYTLGQKKDGKVTPVVRPDGTILRVEYLGSAFVASSSGHVVTNRHVAEPWWRSREIAPLLAAGLVPTFLHLTITFPGRTPQPVDPATIRVSPDGVDLAVFRIDAGGIPPLPLHQGEARDARGRGVAVLGYPTGVSALLARAESEVTRDVLDGATDLQSLIARMADRGLVSPIITQGALTEVRTRRLVYDALTTSGGSGGPVFETDGTVVGVNFAVTRDFQGSNFGVPIRFARALLP